LGIEIESNPLPPWVPMKRFVVQIVKFLAFLLAPVLVVVLGNFVIVNQNSFWKLPNNEEAVVLGHSHPECAFNDSLIPNLINLSLSAETYFYTYIKLKKLIESNDQLKTVFIEFGTNNVQKTMDTWTWGDKYISYNLPKYFSIIDRPEMKLLSGKNLKPVLSTPPQSYAREIGFNYYNLILQDNSVISNKRRYGGYLHLTQMKTDTLIKLRQSRSQRNNNRVLQVSETNMRYLKKILTLCEDNGIKVFLVRSPVHSMYTKPEAEELFNEVLVNQFPNAVLLDFKEFPLANNQFADFGHLNYKGAEIFSRWFAALISKDLLKQEDKQALINKEIKSFAQSQPQ
jgi:hypothetical protein